MTDEEKVLEHLKMIQGVIERMGRNSFQLKAWSAALATTRELQDETQCNIVRWTK